MIYSKKKETGCVQKTLGAGSDHQKKVVGNFLSFFGRVCPTWPPWAFGLQQQQQQQQKLMTLWQLDWASMCPSFEALILWWPKHEPKPIIHRRLLVWSQSGNCNLLHGLGSATRRGAAPPNPTTRQQQAWHRHRTHRPPQCPVQKLHLGKKTS